MRTCGAQGVVGAIGRRAQIVVGWQTPASSRPASPLTAKTDSTWAANVSTRRAKHYAGCIPGRAGRVQCRRLESRMSRQTGYT